MDNSCTQQHQQGCSPHTEVDTVSAETSAFLSTSPVIQQSFLPQGERTPTGNTKKRLRFIVDDAACEGSDDKLSGDEDSDMTPSMGGILLRSDPGTSKRRCRGKANNTTCISEVMAFTSTPDDDTVDLQIADGSSIKVSKAIMRQVRSFNTFFSTDQEQSAYSLSGDDSFAFKVLLAVLHHKLYLLPLRMTFSQLYELATVCDKYDTTEIVSPHVESREWINALWKDSKPCLGSWASWLWICHAFQTGKEKGDKFYGRVLDVLAANMRLRDDKWYFERDNSYVEISIMKCPSKLDPLQETLYKRREALWHACLGDCRKRQDVALEGIYRDYRVIGVQAIVIHHLQDDLSSAETLVGRLLKPHPCPQRYTDALLRPWIQKLSL